MSIKTRLAKLESKCRPPKLIERFQMGTLYGEPATEPLYYPAGHVFTMNDLYDDITLQNSMKKN